VSEPNQLVCLESQLEQARAENARLAQELAAEKVAHAGTSATLQAAIAGQKRLFKWLEDLKAGKTDA
jgi:hypothetical protein